MPLGYTRLQLRSPAVKHDSPPSQYPGLQRLVAFVKGPPHFAMFLNKSALLHSLVLGKLLSATTFSYRDGLGPLRPFFGPMDKAPIHPGPKDVNGWGNSIV